MSSSFSSFGNDLHTGARSYPLIRRRRTFYLISAIVLIVLGTIAVLRGPNPGIEFVGGSEFQISGVQTTDQDHARDVVREHVPDNEPKISVIGSSALRVQTEQLSSDETTALAEDLATAYGVPASDVSSSFIGPTWGSDVTFTALRAVVVFLVLVGTVMALYFRNLKASLAALIALVHDMLLTAVVYVAVGFEITPATVIGFLTILGYSIYDTVVVFDKVRENTADLSAGTLTYEESVELAANQTLVRSINTSVVALLPVGSILVIGAFVLGAGTLKDIALALFVGILAGTYSSIFLAPGILTDLRRREGAIVAHDAEIARARAASAAAPEPEPVAAPAPGAPEAADESAADRGTAPDAPSTSTGRSGAPARVQPRRTTRRRRH
ncbi:protein translocase subunit SecF [Brachybacterium huguangmaarense]|uniref:Protein-export membrane protein SecF n=1 Tax=Brachybacterium huguangmaarense TaxID=1652028 RepID=A0ABY6G014_9MICO|nr:protein translocase subunit SecF [Brachybacterium huguangmaarense]UYG16525.1 protein translocase subunit SecF [Brachybacterium huguangmaarense]